MICRNCGFQNALGDAFCGSCGQFLEWSGEAEAGSEGTQEADGQAAGSGADGASEITDGGATVPGTTPPPPPPPIEDTVVGPTIGSAVGSTGASSGTRTGTGPTGRPTPPPSAIVCWNCGRSNPTSRSFCQQCGERLTAPQTEQVTPVVIDDGGRGRRALAIGAAVLALLLLAGGAAAILLGGGPGPSPTAIAGTSPSPAPTGPAATLSPAGASPTAAAATDSPATLAPATDAPPTDAPVTDAPPTAAPPTSAPAASCRNSDGATTWVNLTSEDPRTRVPQDAVWCVHQVVVVPYFGYGRVRAMVGDFELIDVSHEEATAQAEYSENYPGRRAILIFPGSRVRYVVDCYDADCSFLIQVGYNQIATP